MCLSKRIMTTTYTEDAGVTRIHKVRPQAQVFLFINQKYAIFLVTRPCFKLLDHALNYSTIMTEQVYPDQIFQGDTLFWPYFRPTAMCKQDLESLRAL